MQIRTVELFCGTKSFSRVVQTLGYGTLTIDNDERHDPDMVADILELKEIPRAHVVWASPPCEAFSVAAIGRNWNRDYTPKHVRAFVAQKVVKKTMILIRESRSTWWFVENPRGMLRKLGWFENMVRDLGGVRHTVTYCQYGDTRMKPTDIWTNASWWTPRAPCERGDGCHEAAPRGAKTGTQGLRGSAERGRIPASLFGEIFAQLPMLRQREVA